MSRKFRGEGRGGYVGHDMGSAEQRLIDGMVEAGFGARMALASESNRPPLQRGHLLLKWWNESRQIAGYGPDPTPPEQALAGLNDIVDALKRRGPDEIKVFSKTVCRAARLWRVVGENFLKNEVCGPGEWPDEPNIAFCGKHLDSLIDWAEIGPKVRSVSNKASSDAWKERQAGKEASGGVQKVLPSSNSKVPDDVWQRFERDQHARARGYASDAEMQAELKRKRERAA